MREFAVSYLEQFNTEQKLALYTHKPVEYVENVLNIPLWSKQREILHSVNNNRRTAVVACHGPGKSFIAAQAVLHWIATRPPGTAKVITSAPTFHQVKTILWGEIAKGHASAGLAGEVNQNSEWKIGNEIVAFGRKPANVAASGFEETVAAFQGHHSDNLLIIFDEACGIPKPLWMAALSLMTNNNARFLAIGNPDNPRSQFATVCKPESGWIVIRIPLSATPNFTDEQVESSVRERMPTQQWHDDFVNDFGMGAAYESKVLAQFPDSALDGVIPFSFIQDAKEIEAMKSTEIELGLDVAGSLTGDETIIRARQGNAIGKRWSLRTDDSDEIVKLALNVINETLASYIKIDVIGVGFGVAGHLQSEIRRYGIPCKVEKVNVAKSSTDPKRFKNLRSQLWWQVGREGIKEGIICTANLDDKTAGELIAPSFKINAVGQIEVEQKADTRSKLGRSPDDADALLLAFYKPTYGVASIKTVTNKRLSRTR